MIQEANFPARYSPKFLHYHFPNFYMASAVNKSKGVAVLFAKSCNFTWVADKQDLEDRFIRVKGTIKGHLYSMISYYTPNKGQAAFLKNLFETLAPLLEGMVIFGGDSNAAFDLGLDRTEPPSTESADQGEPKNSETNPCPGPDRCLERTESDQGRLHTLFSPPTTLMPELTTC